MRRAPADRIRLWRHAATLLAAAVLAGCSGDKSPGRTYYERTIEPILLQSCAGNTAGCHVTNADDPFDFAAGNFDVSSFENVQKRRDLLQPFGPYPVPLLLIKAVGPTPELPVAYRDQFHTLAVQHAGGNILQVGSDAYLTLLSWTENGATENGLPPPAPPQQGTGGCATSIPPDFDPAPYQAHPTFAQFQEKVQPVLATCNSGNCHGAAQADLYLTCGDDPTQLAYNFSQVWAFVDEPVDNSQVLQVPLAVSAGGFFHSGGDHFPSRSHRNYADVRDWAEAVGRLEFGEGDPGKQFFAEHVNRVMIQHGCFFEACHSPSAANDFKLRSGSQGFFSAIALERNYELLRNDFLSFEVPDVRRGRAVAKSILRSLGGIGHRGGPVLETPGSGGADPTTCPSTFDPDTATAFCVFQRWLDIERQQLITQGDVLPLGDGDTVPIVYVERQTNHVAGPLEFDTYQADSDLLVADATLDAGGAVVSVGPPRSLLDGCPGASNRAAVDVRSPDVRFDGTTITFAMRTSASDPLGVYTVGLDGSNCTRLTPAQQPQNGIAIHDFDPAWSPDGQFIVFASTRGGADGPTVSRKLYLPQSDLWRMRADGSAVERMTFLTNSEIGPQFMREGRVIMSTEKISENFYQVAGRRLNWDLTDYHPLLAQRADSPFGDPSAPDAMMPSVGYQQATEIREGFDGNFLFVLSDEGARGGAGALGIFNRSVGTFELGRSDPGYLPAMTIVDPAATGRVGSSTNGAYRSPYPLPDGRIMAAYAGYGGDLGAATAFDWDIVAVHPRTGQRTTLIGGPRAQVEAVLALKHPPRKLYENRRQLVFGGAFDPQATGGLDWAIIHIPDAPMIFTLLNANLRRGRPVDLFRRATHLAVYEELPAPPGTSGAGIYESRRFLGRARLSSDGSIKVKSPAGTGIILELQDAAGNVVVTMREEHQVGPGELISLGIREELFDAVCGGCHGSVSGSELDIAITPDALTGASESLSARESPVLLGN